MVNLRKFLKPYKDAGAWHSLLPIRRFVDDRVFLTKRNQLGVVLQVDGIDSECLTDAMLETSTRRMSAAWRSFDDRFRTYQYVVKQNHSGFERSGCGEHGTAETTRRRLEYLESKQPGLFSIQLFFVVLLDPGLLTGKTFVRTRRMTQAAFCQQPNTALGERLPGGSSTHQ